VKSGVASATAYAAEVGRIERWRRQNRACRYTIYALIGAFVLWSVEAIVGGDTDWARITLAGIVKASARFLRLDFSILPDLLAPALETLLMATLATLLGLILAVPVTWLGALNISPLGKFSYGTGRMLMTVSRSVHEIVWGLIFVAAVGLGSLAGILAMAIRSIGFISKTVAEAIEDVDHKPLEAMRAVGANKFQILWYGILPQVIPVFLGNVIFEWDVNVRRSTIMGLVGAGGLGLALHRQMASYNFGGVAMVILVILGLIILGEVLSYYGRKAVL
jgi:phosphonate transport system permease protein